MCGRTRLVTPLRTMDGWDFVKGPDFDGVTMCLLMS